MFGKRKSRVRLSAKDKFEAYRFARRAWILSGGDKQQAEQQLRERVKGAGFSPAIAALIIRMAMLLFEFWISRGIKSPRPQPTEYDLSVGEGL